MSFVSKIFSYSNEPEIPLLKDYASVITDMHSHFIPNIDDGSTSMEESISLLKSMYDLGFRKFITTPHMMSGAYNVTKEVITGGLKHLRTAVEQAQLPITIEAAAEYYVDYPFLEKIQEKNFLTITGNTVLVEISFINLPEKLTDIFFELRVNGYDILLAHPERYPFWYSNFNQYKELKDQGILFQLNINSLSNYYGIAARKIGERLIDENMIEYIGSDMHGERHLQPLKDALKSKYLAKLVAKGVMNSKL